MKTHIAYNHTNYGDSMKPNKTVTLQNERVKWFDAFGKVIREWSIEEYIQWILYNENICRIWITENNNTECVYYYYTANNPTQTK